MKLQSALLLSVLLVLGLAQASASPIGRVLSRLRKTAGSGGSSTPSHGFLYRHLYARTLDLSEHHRILYEEFITERFPNKSGHRIEDVVLSYLPTARDLPSHRENHSDDELLLDHYDNLNIFKAALNRVEETERGNFTDTLIMNAEELHELIRRLETVMRRVGLEDAIGPSQTMVPAFHTNVTTEEHNTRTLLVLQEFDGYIAEVVIDYETLKSRSTS
ncbi:uncharacterized protein LOC117303297 [Asterias rubens]|uniref:uncharacterized protein LOC117303297 n=1 Tax=Asterias rubens TaxID=7604 RepID=UPI001455A8C1|nr:uncharacterized protein LOC117303297 [Asterias rubens]